MAHSRRQFLRNTALASASFLIPDFLKAAADIYGAGSYNGKVLVVVQLSGGNDGLNCLVPYRDDLYYKARPGIGLKDDDIIPVTDLAAFNANLQGLADLYHDGNLSIINNVGYPNPNRSHFRSMDIWQSASDEDKVLTTGWLGRYLDNTCSGECARPHAAIELDDTLSLALKGEQMKGLAFRDPATLHMSSQNRMIRGVVNDYHVHEDHPTVEFLHKTLIETTESADYIYDHSRIYKSVKLYPQHEFGKRMKTVAELICSGSDIRIYYVSLSGFDTHVTQKGQHNRLLKVYGDTLKTFCDDLKVNNRFNDTVVMTFSEFGRRVAQNASLGTDHGTSNNVYIAGGKLAKAGIYNEMPDLKNLDNGDLIYKVDFRQVYSTILKNWLNSPDENILNQKFNTLNFV